MKALTVRQPYAQLILLGAKTVENRTWRTHYRGPLAIHAGARPPTAFDWLTAGSIWQEDQLQPGGDWQAIDRQFEAVEANARKLLGVVLGTVEVVDCVRDQHETNYWAEFGMWHWVLANPQPFAEPIPAKGRQGLWEWER